MYPRPNTPVLTQNNLIWIELSGPQIIQFVNPLHLDLRNMVVLLL